MPREHLGVLVEPDANTLSTIVSTDHTTNLRSVALLDSSVGELRAQLRQRLELAGPVILTGHQPEFAHAGVFAKIIAVDALVVRCGGSGIFLTVDTDVPKNTHLAFPHVEHGEVRRTLLRIPAFDRELPVEWQPGAPASEWREFFERVSSKLEGDETLLPAFVDGLLSDASDPIGLCGGLERGQAAIGRLLGLHDVRFVRTSQLSQTPEFRAFAAHLMLNAADFATHYNEAQRSYRLRHHVRNPMRPAPPLETGGERVELPFWVSRKEQTRRRLLVAVHGDCLSLFADHQPLGSERLPRLRCAQELARGFQIEREGWHLRPRALALSAFTRLFLSDLFVHGIGGAKYDEMTEDFIQRFFGTDLPPACCVTATLHLPLPRYGVGPEQLAAARHARRDVHFNPQRHLRDLPRSLLGRREELITESNRLRKESPCERTARRRVFESIRAVNRELLRFDTEQIAELERQWRGLERQRRSDRVALDREYFYALHRRRTMEELVRRIRAAIA